MSEMRLSRLDFLVFLDSRCVSHRALAGTGVQNTTQIRVLGAILKKGATISFVISWPPPPLQSPPGTCEIKEQKGYLISRPPFPHTPHGVYTVIYRMVFTRLYIAWCLLLQRQWWWATVIYRMVFTVYCVPNRSTGCCAPSCRR